MCHIEVEAIEVAVGAPVAYRDRDNRGSSRSSCVI